MDLIGDFIFAVGSVICHQRPERSFFIDGHQLPVCARCTGLYVSAAAGFLAWLCWKTFRVLKLAPATTFNIGVLKLVAGTNLNTAVDPRAAARVLIVSAIPTALSLIAGTLGVWDGSNVTRAVLALPLGASAGAIVAAVAAKDLR